MKDFPFKTEKKKRIKLKKNLKKENLKKELKETEKNLN